MTEVKFNEDGTLDLSDIPEEMHPIVHHFQEREKRATDLAETAMNRLQQSERDRYVERVEARLADLSTKGVKQEKIKSMRPLLLDMSYANEEIVVDFSEAEDGSKTEVKDTRGEQLFKVLEASIGEMEYGERGTAPQRRADGEPLTGRPADDLSDDELLEEFERFRNGDEGGE